MAARATTFAVLAAAAVASRAAAPRHAPAAHAAPVDVNVDAGGTFARVSMSDPRSATSKPLEHGEHNAAWLFGARAEPNPGAVVTHGPARFTVLTTGVVRLEYSPHRPPVFHDEGSFAFVNRYFETVPDFTASTSDDGVLTLDTPRLTLTYAPAAAPHGAFTPASLRAFIKDTGTTWTPGAPATGSLHAVIRTLDRIGRALSIACVQPAYLNDTHCEEGVASRDGWAVLDDSLGARWEDYNTEWPWTTGRAEPPLPARADTCAAVGWDRWECIWGNHLVNESACRAKGCCWDPVAAAAADGQPTAQHFVAWCWWPDGSASPASEYKDWYLFGFGTDYRAALYDYRDVAGPPALLPNYALGPHYSRWFSYADWEEREIVATFARNAIPLSVMQVDMDWHDSYPRGVPNVPPALSLPRELEPWTGFTIWEDMYPAVADMQAHFHARGVKSMWNLHPHFGIQFYDDVYAEFAARLGRGAEAAEGKPMLGDYVNRTWAEPFFALPIAKLDAHGIDAWWIDWQAGEWTPLAGLSPTAWLSYAFSSNPYRYGAVASRSGPVLAAAGLPADAALSAMAPLPHGDVDGEGSEHEHPPRAPSSAEPSRNGIRFSDRPFIMNRWGGLGSHRYPVGFSGDAETSWDVLKWQTYLTPTAANVAWQWSHDIGGFQGEPSPELMVRWGQFGALSPILRPHTAGRNGANRDIWSFPWPAFEALRDAFRLRARLAPYLVTAQRVGHDTGVVPCHPLYYDFPRADGAYGDEALHQFALGDGLWAAPVTQPAPPGPAAAELATVNVWFPPGPWIEWSSWQRVAAGDVGAGGVRARRYALGETPIFSRPGAIITLATLPAAADVLGAPFSGPADDVTLWVMPPDPVAAAAAVDAAAAAADGGDDDAGTGAVFIHASTAPLYEDDGVSTAYARDGGAFSWTAVTCEWWSGDGDEDVAECSVRPPTGPGFPEAPSARAYTWRFPGTLPPSRVSVHVIMEDGAGDHEGDHEGGDDEGDGGEGGGDVMLLDEPNVPLAQAGVPDRWGDGGVWPSGAPTAWSYAAASASTWVRVAAPVPVAAVVSVTLHYTRVSGGDADSANGDGGGAPPSCVWADPLPTSGIGRHVARARAAKGAMNAAAWSVYAVDVPTLIAAGAAPTRVEAAVAAAADGRLSPDAAAAAVAAEFGALAGALARAVDDVDTVVRGVHSVSDDVSLRMRALAADGAAGGWAD